MRLSIINFAGIARTLVAVGTDSDASIDATTRPATPRSGSIVAALGVSKTGAGLTGACAGAGVETSGAAATGAGAGVETTGAAATGAGAETGVDVTGADNVDGAGVKTCCVAFGIGGVGGVPALGALVVAAAPGLYVLKNSIHEGSTEVGSAWYRSYISSTSQSLAPKSADTGTPHITINLEHYSGN